LVQALQTHPSCTPPRVGDDWHTNGFEREKEDNMSAGALNRIVDLAGLRRRRIRVWLLLVIGMALSLAWLGSVGQQTGNMGWHNLSLPVGYMTLCVFLLALGCEMIDSSLGMGYGTTLTPLLLLMGFEPLAVVPCVLFSEMVTGALAGFMHHHDGNVDFKRDKQVRKTVVLLSLLSVLGSVTAVFVALSIPKFYLKLSIGIIILIIGVLVLATRKQRLKYRQGHIIGLGIIAAFNKGLSGGGYGPLVCAGQIVSGIGAKQASAITSLAESFTSFVGLIAYILIARGQVNWGLALPLVIGASLSVPIATLVVRRLREDWMRTAVGVFTCVLAGLTLYQTLA
jgi:uncharacterized membrane protein YfcA